MREWCSKGYQAVAASETVDPFGTILVGGGTTGGVGLYSKGTLTDLGVPPGATTSDGSAINASGDVLVRTNLRSDSLLFLNHNGSWIDLWNQPKLVGDAGAGCCPLNAAGEILGATSSGEVLYTGGLAIDLGFVPAAINDAGDIVGHYLEIPPQSLYAGPGSGAFVKRRHESTFRPDRGRCRSITPGK